MKKLFMILTIIISSTTLATLKYDPMTKCFYSKNAPKNVNQAEYHKIICEMTEVMSALFMIQSIGTEGILKFTDHNLAFIFTCLKRKETPTALQVIKDIEEFIKEYRKNIKHVQNL